MKWNATKDGALKVLLEVGEKLARSLGHGAFCSKQHCPCDCGAGEYQAQVLAEWQHLKEDLADEQH